MFGLEMVLARHAIGVHAFPVETTVKKSIIPAIKAWPVSKPMACKRGSAVTIEIILGWDHLNPRRRTVSPSALPALADEIRDLLEQTEQAPVDPFMIIARSGQNFMQCLSNPAGWLLEKREGDERHHYRALEPIEPSKAIGVDSSLMQRIFNKPRHRGWNLTRELITEAMVAYATGAREPDWLEWERIEV